MTPSSKVELYAAIRRDSRTGGLSVRALAKKYGVHRRTVREAPASSIATQTTSADGVYVVVERDSLWGIAEERLGDPQRWKEIYELNRFRVQPDGGVLTDPEIIRPGWTLTLPADAGANATSHDPVPVVVPRQQGLSVQAPSTPSAVAAPTSTPSSTPSSVSIPHEHRAPSEVRRPVAVHLPTGGYVSLTLGAGLAAALAAASVR